MDGELFLQAVCVPHLITSFLWEQHIKWQIGKYRFGTMIEEVTTEALNTFKEQA